MAPKSKNKRGLNPKSAAGASTSSSSSERKSKRLKAKEVVPESDPVELPEDFELDEDETEKSKPVPTRKRAKDKKKNTKTGAGACSSKSKRLKAKEVVPEPDPPVEDELPEDFEFLEEEDVELETEGSNKDESKPVPTRKRAKRDVNDDSDCKLIGEPVPVEEAKQRWPHRYDSTKPINDDEDVYEAHRHYTKAVIEGVIFNLNDDAFIKAEEGMPDYIGRIVELFEATDKKKYFTAQWFFKAVDTVIQKHSTLVDEKRVFYSDLKNVNPLDCITSKIKIVQVAPNMDLVAKEAMISPCDFYYDMSYSIPFCTFKNLPTENGRDGNESSSTISSEASCEGEQQSVDVGAGAGDSSKASTSKTSSNMTLLDLYSGCGAMSTGLCMGAALSGVNLVTRWAVDINEYACQSLKYNHPETEVRNESADDFLSLLKAWKKLCEDFSLLGPPQHSQTVSPAQATEENEDNDDDEDEDDEDEDEDEDEDGSDEVFEVGNFVGICFGDPNECEKPGLYFKVRWKGYGPSDDTWEPVEGLENCKERIQEFVTTGYKSNMLPLPGDVDVICGGPPCQGISGFNRFRNKNQPLEDPKNRQLIVFMDIVDYLKPKYVLMENVVDIMKFADGFLGRYALGRLVAMNYQTRLGLMVAGRYGLPQFRMRAFFWGACPTEKLPPYPLPTHDVVGRGFGPTEFVTSAVIHNEPHNYSLENALYLGDAISDLPPVTTYESRDEIPYVQKPLTKFQKHIRLSKHELLGAAATGEKKSEKTMLYDHLPLPLNDDDYQRVCQIPREKGANFRNLPGVVVGADNKVELDPTVPRKMLPNGKPLVPDYALKFVKGISLKPFGRLWWDEIVTTVVTRAEPHNQAILHPDQDRVLSVRENARLQGFPDYYKLFGPVKQRYIQVGNAVAVPVARALGYALGMACQRTCNDEPLLPLPPGFPNTPESVPLATVDVEDANC